MPALGPVVLGAIVVLALILVSLVFQGRRTARARQSSRGELGLLRVAIPDPVLAAGILSAVSPGAGAAEYALTGLERVTSAQPGAWYVAMLKTPPRGAGTADAGAARRVLLVIDGLPPPDASRASGEPAFVPGTDHLWTQRWTSSLLLVEGVPDAGDAVRDLERMKDAGAKAVLALAAQALPTSQNLPQENL
jgi:hypothetical protein